MSSFWESEKELTEIQKNKREKVIVNQCTRQGKEYLDFRIHAKKEDDTYVPTSKGFNLEFDIAKTLLSYVLEQI